MQRVFPQIEDLKRYNVQALKADATAGLTVALVLIPQSMAYAQLAGLPAFYGLYAALLPPVAGALFGSSRQLATGPVAVVSLMTAACLEPVATAGSQAFIGYAILLALVVGLFQLALGLLRLGLVINFMSHPVINGFTNAAALIIATSQLPKLFGVHVDQAALHYQTVIKVFKTALTYTHWPAVAMSALALAVIYGLKRYDRRMPSVLIAVALTTFLSWAVGYQQERSARLDDLENQAVKVWIKDFNQAVGESERLAGDLAAINRRADQAAAAEGESSLAAITLRHEARVRLILIDDQHSRAAVMRERLRSLLFEAEPGGTGRPVYRITDRAGNGLFQSRRPWRLQVGRRELDETALTMHSGGEVLGGIPAGLPRLGLPPFEPGALNRLFPYAAIIAMLGFMETISVAKAMAAKTGQRIDPNRELIGQGLANLLGSVSGSYPVSGSFSRSAVNLQAGARTGLSSAVTSLAVVVTLLFLTPVLYHLPQAVLAAVIMAAVAGLLNLSGFVHAWRAQRHDGIISIITFAATLALAPHLEWGIVIGVVLSLFVFLYRSMRPRVAALAMAPDCAFHDANQFHLAQCSRIAVIRFDAPLFYANAGFLEDKISERRKAMPELRHIVIAGDGMNDIDASGEETLSLIIDRVRSAGQKISFSSLHSNVIEALRRTHLLAKIGPENIFPTLSEAVAAIHPKAHEGADEKECPLLQACPLEPDNKQKET